MFDQFRPFGSRGLFLQTFQIIVPVTDVGVVPFDVRSVDPFVDLDLCLVWLRTFMDLQKILKAFSIIVAAQRERFCRCRDGKDGWNNVPLHSERYRLPRGLPCADWEG